MNKLIDKFGKKAVIIAIVSLSIAVVFALTGAILMLVSGISQANAGGGGGGYNSSLARVSVDTEYFTYDTEEAFNFYAYENSYLVYISNYRDIISVSAYSVDGEEISGLYSSVRGGYILNLPRYGVYTIRINAYSRAIPYDYMISELTII